MVTGRCVQFTFDNRLMNFNVHSLFLHCTESIWPFKLWRCLQLRYYYYEVWCGLWLKTKWVRDYGQTLKLISKFKVHSKVLLKRNLQIWHLEIRHPVHIHISLFVHSKLSIWICTCVPSLLSIRALTLSACPLSFIILAHDLGSQTLRTLSVDPLTITVPEGFMARLKNQNIFFF